MPEPVRPASNVDFYIQSPQVNRQSPQGGRFQDTVQISGEAQQKCRELLSKINDQFSSEQSSQEPPSQNIPDIFRIAPNATKDEIRSAYLAAIKRYHPDNFATLPEEFQELAEEKSKQINLVYKKLMGG
jgi:DnaJ-domain-containing protein 1